VAHVQNSVACSVASSTAAGAAHEAQVFRLGAELEVSADELAPHAQRKVAHVVHEGIHLQARRHRTPNVSPESSARECGRGQFLGITSTGGRVIAGS
jgi:hypothetical protein